MMPGPLYKRPIFWLIVSPLLLLLVWLFLLPDQSVTNAVDPATYRTKLVAGRQEKDEFMRSSADSPISDKATFDSLRYFDPDPAFRVVARLDPFPSGQAQKLVVRLTDGSEEVYDQYGHARFTLSGQVCRLLVLKHEDELVLLFRDATSGRETYGGGRYVDVDPNTVHDNEVVLDFNTAYNPYCAYNPSYACPLPPADNKLPIAVRAGERYEHTP